VSEQDEITVEYKRAGKDAHQLLMKSDAVPDIRIDWAGIPTDQRAGTSVKLLCASALYCFASTLGSALTARKANVKSLTGRATARKDKDESFRARVTEISMEISVEIDDEDLPALKKCESIMKRGCLVTYSLDKAIQIKHKITRL